MTEISLKSTCPKEANDPSKAREIISRLRQMLNREERKVLAMSIRNKKLEQSLTLLLQHPNMSEALKAEVQTLLSAN